MSTRRRRAGRLGRLAVAAGLVLGASSVDLTPTTAQADPGLGKAQAQLVVIDPRSAQLSFGVRFGPTVADHRNQVARATAQSTDYGIIASALTGDGCDGGAPPVARDQLPQVMRADSRIPEDATERSVQEGPITQSVRADAAPFAQGRSRLAELDIPGVARVVGASNRTRSGVDDQGRAFSAAEVHVDELALAGGLVQLEGLRWSAFHGGGRDPEGAFTIAGASILGTPLPSQDPVATIAAINDALGLIGLVLSPPLAHVEDDVLFVDPIRIGVAPNATRDEGAGAVLAAIQPIREGLFDAVLAADCNSGAVITVIDIFLGSATGGGSLTVQVGGAQAGTTRPDLFSGLGEGGSRPAVAAPAADRSATQPATRLPIPTAAPAPAPAESPDDALLGAPTGTVDDDPVSDGALAVGLATIGLGLALAEGDRRMMRRAATDDMTMEAT